MKWRRFGIYIFCSKKKCSAHFFNEIPRSKFTPFTKLMNRPVSESAILKSIDKLVPCHRRSGLKMKKVNFYIFLSLHYLEFLKPLIHTWHITCFFGSAGHAFHQTKVLIWKTAWFCLNSRELPYSAELPIMLILCSAIYKKHHSSESYQSCHGPINDIVIFSLQLPVKPIAIDQSCCSRQTQWLDRSTHPQRLTSIPCF